VIKDDSIRQSLLDFFNKERGDFFINKLGDTEGNIIPYIYLAMICMVFLDFSEILIQKL